ncbi:MAG: basic amino acid ABC transporter substrate-binding protein [Lachnospiraceae bacterium]|nr:basic amino acid ABC transporter substrate-binding protein [Lachnospiraceae bacterium]
MKKFTKFVALASAVVMAVACMTGCGSKASGKIVFGTNAEFPPFEFVSANGVIDTYDGIDICIAKQIGEDNGMTAEIANMEFDSLLVAIQNGQIDAAIAGMTVTDERAQSVDFSIPYYNATQVIIVKEGSDITCAADLAEKFTAVVQGYTGETCITELGYKYESFKKGTECIMELVNGKCDAVVIDSATASKYVSDNAGLVIVTDEEAFGSEQYAIAVKKGNTELLNKINATIEKMLEDGTIANLSDKYCTAE